MNRREPLILALAIATWACACGLLSSPGMRTIEEIAHAACVIVFGDPKLEPALKAKLGSSAPEDFCRDENVIRPFIAQQRAGMSAAKASLARPAQ